jgi:GNAT superfamily N-acetyltransferase
VALAVRRGSVADAPTLSAFAERIFRETFAPDNRPEDIDAYVAPAYNPARQAAELADPALDTLLGEVNDELVAYAQLREGEPPTYIPADARELWRFYVDRAWHGRGVAQAMMAAVVEAARARGAGTVWLAVWERNPRARAFYTGCGFSDVGSRPFRMGDDLQTDVLMARRIGSPRAASTAAALAP